MKQLEKEYKDQISLETPDLWSRIEAGVDKYESERPETSEPSQGTQKSEDNTVNYKTRKVMYTIGRITVAAVCVLTIFATVNFFRGGLNKSASFEDTKAIDTAPAAAENAASYTYAFDAVEEAEIEEATVEEASENIPIKEAEKSELSVEYDADNELVNSLDELFNIDYEGQLTKQLDELGFSNISDLTYKKLDLAKSSNIYSGSFTDEDTGDKCDITYTISIKEIEIIYISRASDNEVLYEKQLD